MRILLLSAYDTVSHRLWRENLQRLFPDTHWRQLALPPRHFQWRVRSNSLSWGLSADPDLDAGYDLLIATSMVDLAALRGLRPAISNIPTLLYFHENQFFYPDNPTQKARHSENVEPLLIPLYSALCANRILFNSDFNRRTFLDGARKLFARLPESLPETAWQKLEGAEVLPVPLHLENGTVNASRTESFLQVVWNHRWEYDKGPELLLEILRHIERIHLPVQFHVVGQQFRTEPDEFREIRKLCQSMSAQLKLADAQLGYIEQRCDYEALLGRCDVALSTAWHEFQGLGIQEACLAGCSPLAPDDLAYPEYLPADCLYPRQASAQKTAETVCKQLQDMLEKKANGEPLPVPDLSGLSGAAIKTRYQQVFDSLVTEAGTTTTDDPST